MKCRKCGRDADPGLTFCPSCGVRLKAEPDLDEITNAIAGKVDLFMSENESDEAAFDGIKIVDGEMVADDPEEKTATRRVDEEEQTSDSVFDDISRSLGSGDEEEYGSVFTPEKEEPKEEVYAARQKAQPEKEGKKPKKTGLTVGIVIAAVVVVGVIIACFFAFGVFGSKNTESDESEETAAEDSITASVSSGNEYSAPLEITLESELGYRIYYTLDGSTPSADSALYSGSVSLGESYVKDSEGTEITLKAVSYTDNSIKSAEFEVTFTLVYAEIDAPSISPSSGNYSEETYITITAVSGAKIYYTTDGTTPTTESSLYTGQFEMERGNTVVSAIAVKNGLSSAVTTAVYNLDIPSNYTFNDAKEIILEYLINRGDASDDEGNTPDGGSVDFMDGGTCIIDNDQYIVVLCYFYDEEGLETESRIYGVEDQTGTYAELQEDDSGYIIK